MESESTRRGEARRPFFSLAQPWVNFSLGGLLLTLAEPALPGNGEATAWVSVRLLLFLALFVVGLFLGVRGVRLMFSEWRK